jgi:membrane associated rhomboid family serine protease
MHEVEFTTGRLLRMYWLFVWRGVIGGLVIGAVIGFVIGFVMGATGFTKAQIAFVTSIAGVIVGAVWSVVVLKMLLKKQYSDFRIALIER